MTLHAVNRNSAETVFSQIARALKDEIEAVYQSGDYLPSEQQLADRFCVNRHTLRRAVDELVQSGYVERRHGKGTRVVDRPLDYSMHRHSRFTESLAAKGKRAHNHVIRKLVIPARGGTSQRLQLPEGEQVIFIETLRKVDDAPFCVISHFLPLNGFEYIASDYGGGSLHSFLKRTYDVDLHRTESLVTSIQPRGDDAGLLNMPQQMSILRVKSLNVDKNSSSPVEYAVTRFRSDRIQLSVNF
jgi:GntR family phosphonate transport system transcriptional regulator